MRSALIDRQGPSASQQDKHSPQASPPLPARMQTISSLAAPDHAPIQPGRRANHSIPVPVHHRNPDGNAPPPAKKPTQRLQSQRCQQQSASNASMRNHLGTAVNRNPAKEQGMNPKPMAAACTSVAGELGGQQVAVCHADPVECTSTHQRLLASNTTRASVKPKRCSANVAQAPAWVQCGQLGRAGRPVLVAAVATVLHHPQLPVVRTGCNSRNVPANDSMGTTLTALLARHHRQVRSPGRRPGWAIGCHRPVSAMGTSVARRL